MNAVHVIASLPDFGGTPLKLAAEAKHAHVVELSFACLVDKGEVGEKLEREGHSVRVFRRCRWNPLVLWDLVRYIRERHANVVCCHFTRAGIWGRLAALLANVPCVMFEHGLARNERFPYVLLDRLLARATRFVVANSAATAGHLRRVLRVPEERLRVAYPVVDFTPRPRRRKEGGAFRIGTVGGLNEHKGHVHLIEAMALLVSNGVDCEVEIVGEGPLRGELQKVADARGVSLKLRMPGYRADIPEFLSNLDVFAFPSVSEGFGIALVEAMLAGIPVVCSDAGALTEIVTDGVNGLMCRAGDAQALADAIYRLLRDPDFAERLSNAALADANRRFGPRERSRAEEVLLEAVCLS